MGGAATEQGAATLHRANIPVFAYPDTAARMFATMWRYADNLRSLYETPTLPHGSDAPDRTTVTQMGQHLRAAGCTLPNEAQAMEVLGAYGIPTVPTVAAHSAEEAVALAGSMGYPVVLKLLSSTVTHKTDVGGVQLNLHDAAAVRHAYDAIMASVRAHVGDTHIDGVTVQPQVADGYELILGSSVDEQWGPMLVFGAGGYLVEVLDDRALGLPPLTTTLARRMIEQTRIAKALHGSRGRAAVDLLALEQVLVRFSQLVVEQPWIKEIEINPLLARSAPPAGQLPFVALDARVVAHPPGVSDTHLPKPAIRPYPLQYVRRWTLRDSSAVTIRPIRPEDEPLIVQFHHTLGERSVYLRYFAPMSLDTRTAHERLTRICFVDYDREIALVADREDPHTGEHAIIAVGRLIKLHNKNEAEYAGVVSDQWQGHGLGSEMLRQLLQVGRDEGLERIVADVLPENRAMQRVFSKLGFRLKHAWDEGLVHAHIDISTGTRA
jgi:acetyltransferase